MHGTEVMRTLRQACFGAPIIVVSANAYAADRKQAYAAGCDDFIAKPLKLNQLLRKIRLHLSLDWILRGDEVNPAETMANAPMMMPPKDELAQLAQFARIGDLRGLTDRLQQLATNDFAYLPFAIRLQNMAKEFRLADIKQMLKGG